MTILIGAAVAAVFIAAAVKIFFWYEETPVLAVRTDLTAPFELEKIDRNGAVFSTKVPFENAGSQYATISDCLVRAQLPFEQYDGLDVRAKAETEGRPREDDYFEAVLVGKKSSLGIIVKVKLAPRKGLSMTEALSGAVDIPLDIIYTELGRRPWRMDKARITLTAEDISALTGVKLKDD